MVSSGDRLHNNLGMREGGCDQGERSEDVSEGRLSIECGSRNLGGPQDAKTDSIVLLFDIRRAECREYSHNHCCHFILFFEISEIKEANNT